MSRKVLHISARVEIHHLGDTVGCPLTSALSLVYKGTLVSVSRRSESTNSKHNFKHRHSRTHHHASAYQKDWPNRRDRHWLWRDGHLCLLRDTEDRRGGHEGERY